MKPSAVLETFSLLKTKKRILWFGRREELPPKSLGKTLSEVQFVSFDSVTKLDAQKYFPVVLVSLANAALHSGESGALGFDGACREYLSRLSHRSRKILLVSESVLPEPALELVNQVHFHRVLSCPKDVSEIESILQAELDRAEQQQLAEARRKQTRSASLQLETRTTDLEALVTERTAHIQKAKRQIEEKVSSVRNLIRFIKELSLVSSMEDVLQLMRSQARLFHEVKDPLLAFRGPGSTIQFLYFQGSSVLLKDQVDEWPRVEGVRFNDKGDSQYLANIYGRPFAQVLTIPLSIMRSSDHKDRVTPGVLFFEHSLGDEKRRKFIQFIEERLKPMSLALDRLFLESDLRDASFLWERTFDGISDPVAIFDGDTQLIRSNQAFQSQLQGLSSDELFGDRIEHGDRLFEVHTYPISGGRDVLPTSVVIHYVDITVRHQLQKQMIQQEKMAALGHLAGNIAHELNNPLTGIRSLSQVILKSVPLDSRVSEDLVEVEKAAARCQSIISNLLEFSKGGVGKKLQLVSVNEVVDKTMPLLKTLLSRYSCELLFDNTEPKVMIEPQLMQQVVFNLIKNASQAMAGGGRLVIGTGTGVKYDKPMVFVKVKDSGAGIPESIRDQVFNFFFTTKEEGKGTGLGLSMSRSIVRSFGGDLVLESTGAQGSEFAVWLPVAEEVPS